MPGPYPSRFRISSQYQGLIGMERYCREECSRSGPASVWRVYAYLWSHQAKTFGSEKAIQRGTSLSAGSVNHAISVLWERGVVEFDQ